MFVAMGVILKMTEQHHKWMKYSLYAQSSCGQRASWKEDLHHESPGKSAADANFEWRVAVFE